MLGPIFRHVTLLVLVGDREDWTSARVCAEMVAAMRARGASAEIVVYPGAFPYFDVVGRPGAFLPDSRKERSEG